jgi:phospholipid/cholesterol/gamma-HCH transport system substrate-binding protein
MRPRRKNALARGIDRLESHRLVLGVLVAALGIAAAAVSIDSINGLPFTSPYRGEAVVPASAPIVRPGDEVRVAGQPVGEVRGVSLASTGRLVSFDLTSGVIGRGARAAVRLRGLAGAVYLELDPGDTSRPEPSGSRIPRSRTSTGTQLTDVVAAFDRRTRQGLRRTIDGVGTGMLGRGEQLNATEQDAPPLLDEGAPLARAVAGQGSGDLATLVGDAGGLAGAVAAPGDLGPVLAKARATFEALAADRRPLRATIGEAPGALAAARHTLPVADPLLSDLKATSRTLSPVVARLDRAVPRVDRLLGRRHDIDVLARIADAAGPAARAAGPALARLTPASETVAPLAAAIAPLAAYVARYPQDVLAGPHGFTTWGRFRYGEGQAAGHRAVRFTPVLAPPCGRDPYPAPGQVAKDRGKC